MKRLRISIVQMAIEKGKVEHNLKRLLHMMEGAKKTDVVIAPELALTGYVDDYKFLKEDVNSAVEELKYVAREKNIYIISGFPIVRKDHVYNAALVFTPDGEVAHIYRKVHLFPPFGEEEKFQKGEKPQLFSLNGVKSGLLLCYDLRFPELARYYALSGAHVIFNLAMWPESRFTHQYTLSRARAIENQVFFVTCNASGGKFSGKSHVFRPDGELLFQAPSGEGVFNVNVDVTFVGRWRNEFPSISRVRRDINWCRCD